MPALALGAALAALVAAPWVAGAQAPPPPPGEPEDEAKEMIVMVRGTLGGAETFGAGILVGSRSDRLYIATANHVVRKGLDEVENLRVELRSVPGEAIEANLLEHVDEELDLAVLNVPGLSERHISVEGLPFDLLGDPDALERGDPVFHVGNPNGTEWRSNVTPDAVSRVVGTEIRFESYSIAPGSSGGGLFDERWNLVGIVRADQPPDAVAIPIDLVLARMEVWGYPVDLAPSPRAGEGEPGDREEHESAGGRDSGCSLSGTVFNSVTNEPLPGVILGFETYTEDPRDAERVVFNSATTGLDGEYRADCLGIDQSKFPLRVMLSHPNWKAIQVTHVKVERGMERSDVNFPVAIRDSDLEAPPRPEPPVDRGDAGPALPRGEVSIYVLGVPEADAAISRLRAAGYRANLYGPEGRPADEFQVISVGSRVPVRVAQEVIAIARRALPNLRYVVITEDRPSVARAGGTIGGRDVRREISLAVTNRALEDFSSARPMPESGFTRLMAAVDDAAFTRVVRAYYSVE